MFQNVIAAIKKASEFNIGKFNHVSFFVDLFKSNIFDSSEDREK